MKRCACGNTDAWMFAPFSVAGPPIRYGWRCVKCSRFRLAGVE